MIKYTLSTHKFLHALLLTIFLPIFFEACSFSKYSPKPLDLHVIATAFEAKDPFNAKFNHYLQNNGYSADTLPIKIWGTEELILCALYFHPDLDIAREKWRTATLNEVGVAQKPWPMIDGNIAHSNRANNDISPFALGLSIGLLIEPANKRNIRIEDASHLSQAAKLDIAQTAWLIRGQAIKSLLNLQFNQQQIKLHAQEYQHRKDIVAIYQKRVNLGVASKLEFSNANLQLLAITSELNSEKQNTLVLLANLAKNVGLTLHQIEKMQFTEDSKLYYSQEVEPLLKDLHFNRGLNFLQTQDLQVDALLNRLDVRIALERYAVAEAKLKLEVAKQYPDLTISPGYAYEFGDRIWLLGVSGLLTLLNKNKAGIAQATQLREVEAAEFIALQAKIISEANTAKAEVSQAYAALENQQQLQRVQEENLKRVQQKFLAGEVDRLALNYAKIENDKVEKNGALANFHLKMMLNQLENTLQKPLTVANLNAVSSESLQ